MDIERVVVDDLERWKRLGETKKAIVEADRGGKDGWWRMKYLPQFGRFEYPTDEELRLADELCSLCTKVLEKQKSGQVEVGEDEKSIRIKNVWYIKQVSLLLEDDTFEI